MRNAILLMDAQTTTKPSFLQGPLGILAVRETNTLKVLAGPVTPRQSQ